VLNFIRLMSGYGILVLVILRYFRFVKLVLLRGLFEARQSYYISMHYMLGQFNHDSGYKLVILVCISFSVVNESNLM
jgi:hypothetical protein